MCHYYIAVTSSYHSRRQCWCNSTSSMPGWDGKGIGMVQVEAEKKGGGDADETAEGAGGCAGRAHYFQFDPGTEISAGRDVLLLFAGVGECGISVRGGIPAAVNAVRRLVAWPWFLLRLVSCVS